MGKNKKKTTQSREELMMLVISDIVQQLIAAHESGEDLHLNAVKRKSAAKYGLENAPRLIDIIAGVPASHKKALLPKLKAKPVRTASGIAVVAVMCKPHRCGLTKVEASLIINICLVTLITSLMPSCPLSLHQMSSHRDDGKHLRLLSRRPRF